MSYATALLFQQHSLKSTLELLQMEKCLPVTGTCGKKSQFIFTLTSNLVFRLTAKDFRSCSLRAASSSSSELS